MKKKGFWKIGMAVIIVFAMMVFGCGGDDGGGSGDDDNNNNSNNFDIVGEYTYSQSTQGGNEIVYTWVFSGYGSSGSYKISKAMGSNTLPGENNGTWVVSGNKVTLTDTSPQYAELGQTMKETFTVSESGSEITFTFSGSISNIITAYFNVMETSLTLKIKMYNVEFIPNGGAPAPQDQFVKGGKYLTSPEINKEGYSLVGWYKEENFINKWDFDYDRVTSDITLYAKWDFLYTITFNANGGTPAPECQYIFNNSKVKQPEIISKSGYAFIGWYKEEDFINEWEFDKDIVTSDITLFAKWLKAQYPLTDVLNVSVSRNHTVAIKADGTLWAWGFNGSGQLGDGTKVSKFVPTKIGSDNNWKFISASSRTIAIKDDGSLWAWGTNEASVPTKKGTDTNWKSISDGINHTVAIKDDGSLWAWGYNSDGQLGNGTTTGFPSVPIKIGTDTDWASVSAGFAHTIAIKSDGTLWAWGDNRSGQLGDGTGGDEYDNSGNKNTPTKIGSDTNWAFVSAGEQHTVAIKTDGTLWAWGNNQYHQLGDGTGGYNNSEDNKNTPTKIGLDTNWASVSAGTHHTVAIKTDNTLWAWGYNGEGQLGDGTGGFGYDKLVPAKIGSDNNWKSVSAGYQHTVAIKTDGTLWAWGRNASGQLGNGLTTNRTTPTQVFIYE